MFKPAPMESHARSKHFLSRAIGLILFYKCEAGEHVEELIKHAREVEAKLAEFGGVTRRLKIDDEAPEFARIQAFVDEAIGGHAELARGVFHIVVAKKYREASEAMYKAVDYLEHPKTTFIPNDNIDSYDKAFRLFGCGMPALENKQLRRLFEELAGCLITTEGEAEDDDADRWKYERMEACYNSYAMNHHEETLDPFAYCTMGHKVANDGEGYKQCNRLMLANILMKPTVAASKLADQLGVSHPFLIARYLLNTSVFKCPLRCALPDFLAMPLLGV